ncbi:MAG TPA: polysaccharide biosynthesis protein [Pseudolabrys sp.]|nr:polysaccharide biosynthesis protein [Pseudolabrys sp.]
MKEATLVGERVLVIGGTGSLGRALLARLTAKNSVMLFSRDEAKHWTIRNQYGAKGIDYAVGDIRDFARVEETILRFRPTVIIIAAALKQVDTCEMTPYESIQTNVLGIRNVIDAVIRQVDRLPELNCVLMVSTDKACAPANVYGMCKAIAERLVTSQCLALPRPKFVGVRYGNVLESRGSIIPLFRWQAENHRCLTVTHRDMTRFVMTLDQSIDLISAAVLGAASGEIWLPRLHSMRIIDLAEIFSEHSGKPIEIVGMRPGEKLHEDLISQPESVRVKFKDGYYRMAPAHITVEQDAKIFGYSSSEDVLSKRDLETYLQSIGIFQRKLSDFVGREIDEIAAPTLKRTAS